MALLSCIRDPGGPILFPPHSTTSPHLSPNLRPRHFVSLSTLLSASFRAPPVALSRRASLPCPPFPTQPSSSQPLPLRCSLGQGFAVPPALPLSPQFPCNNERHTRGVRGPPPSTPRPSRCPATSGQPLKKTSSNRRFNYFIDFLFLSFVSRIPSHPFFKNSPLSLLSQGCQQGFISGHALTNLLFSLTLVDPSLSLINSFWTPFVINKCEYDFVLTHG